MSFSSGYSFPNSLLLQRIPNLQWPLLFYAATWTTVLTVTVVVASFPPELAFVAAISPSSAFSHACRQGGAVWLPLDDPSESFCFQARLFRRSRIDVIVPPIFAAVIVAGSAFVVKAMGLWEADDDQL